MISDHAASFLMQECGFRAVFPTTNRDSAQQIVQQVKAHADQDRQVRSNSFRVFVNFLMLYSCSESIKCTVEAWSIDSGDSGAIGNCGSVSTLEVTT